MKKIILAISLLSLLMVFFGCGPKDTSVPSTGSNDVKATVTPEITKEPAPEAAKRVITLAVEQYPPFNYQIDGNYQGVSFEVAKEAFKRMGVELRLSQYPWERMLQLVKDGGVDAIMTAFKSKEREEYMYFPEEAVSEDIQTIFVKEDSSFVYTDHKSLESIRLGIMRGYSYGDEFDQLVETKVLKTEAVDSQEQNIKKLFSNRIDAFLESNLVTYYALRNMNMTGGIKEAGVFRVTKLYVTFTKKGSITEADVAAFDKAVRSMKEDGTYKKIVDQYLTLK